ncbi:MAG: LacI family transcriptional regulator [Candidatus Competibacteraceae bacterium]|nr:LacI family transcriptional regulator [Candidatus Competibacteraceae bacterium]
MITVKDIANKLGVSPSTVTRALANSSRISLKTKKLVQRTAAEMGYVPNAAAKTMRGEENSLIGLLIPDIENNFYAQIAKAFSEVCNSHDFQLTLAVSDDNPNIEERHIRQLVAARCAGIAIVPTATLTQQSVSLLASRNTAQLIRRNSALNTDWYGINDTDALRSATNCLLDLNHRRIGLICGEPALDSGNDRYQGYASALQARNIPLDPTLIMRGPPRTRFAQAATNRLRALSHPPSAIVAAGAGLSEGMLNAVATWSKDDQHAFSLIGYSDSSAFSWWGGSGLTAIALPIHQIAADLCGKLIQLARDKTSRLAESEDYLYDSHLILRGSVRPYKDISGSLP